MLFQQELCLIWSSLELFMAMTHLFVFLGFRNSKLGFLRRQHNYFLLDAFTHLINLLLYSPKNVGYILYGLWIYAAAVHLYLYRNLTTNPPPRRNQDGKVEEDNAHKISRIFHWSCVEYKPNRFSIFESGKEMFETIIDITNHTAGFILGFRMIHSYWYKIGAIIVMFAIFYQRMLGFKYFLTEPKMMPPQLRGFFKDYSTAAMTN